MFKEREVKKKEGVLDEALLRMAMRSERREDGREGSVINSHPCPTGRRDLIKRKYDSPQCTLENCQEHLKASLRLFLPSLNLCYMHATITADSNSKQRPHRHRK